MIAVCGELLGTPKYMAPEQIDGKSLTTACDIFALGVVLYELFSGREPFPAEGPLGYLRANSGDAQAPLALVESSVPSDLSTVVDRMLAKDPAERYRRAHAVLTDLDQVEARLDGHRPQPAADAGADTTSDAAPTPAPASGPWKAVAVTALAMVVLLTACVLYLLMDKFERMEELRLAQAPPLPAGDPGVRAPPLPDPNQGPVTPPVKPEPPKPEPPVKPAPDLLETGLAAAQRALDMGEPEKALSGP